MTFSVTTEIKGCTSLAMQTEEEVHVATVEDELETAELIVDDAAVTWFRHVAMTSTTLKSDKGNIST